MARPSAKKRRQNRPASFHEALPLALPSAAAISHVADHLEEAAAVWGQGWRLSLARLRAQPLHSLPRLLCQVGLQAGGWLQTALRQAPPKLRRWAGQASRRQTKLNAQSVKLGQRFVAALSHYLNQLAVMARRSTQHSWSYAPAIGLDISQGAHWTAQRLRSKAARRLLLAGLIAAGGLAAYGVTTLAARTFSRYANSISSPAALMAQKKTGTTILDKNGAILYQGYGARNQGFVPLSNLPDSLKDATIAAEDPDFYKHAGFSWQGTLRASLVDLQHGSSSQGGSTLTQQLIKNTLLTQDKNFTRKFSELLLSIKIEQRYSKDQILEMYLNSIYYGQGAAGVQAAAQTYFHKDAHDLTLGEAALIAGLPLGPSRFDPNYDLPAATGRRDYVLSRMVSLGKITKADADAAKAQPLAIHDTPAATSPNGTTPVIVYSRDIKLEAPHFVFYVLDQLRQQYGDDLVEFGGITVHTTLDLGKQHLAERIVSERVSALSSHHVTNGGLLSLDPQTGAILAMVGSVDYNAPGFGNVNVTLASLQPGSSFKPIAYATAFKKGWTGATTVDDTPLSIPMSDGSVYTPLNYDLKFHGKVTLRHALDNSLNIPAVKVLQYAGLHDTIQTAHDLGITTLQDESQYGPSLVLGGGEVRMLDMAAVYGTFANNGVRVTPQAITKVDDRMGQDITKTAAHNPATVLDPRIAYMITNILADDTARQPEFPANGPLKLSRPAAAKTGTTNDFRDNWTVGYTPQMVTAVWVGNNDHTAMQNVDGITGAAPIWHDYMEGAHGGLPVENFTVPAGLTIASICSDGGLADGFTTGLTEVFMSDALPANHCHQPASPSPTPAPGSDSSNPADNQDPVDAPPSPTPKPGRIKPLGALQ